MRAGLRRLNSQGCHPDQDGDRIFAAEARLDWFDMFFLLDGHLQVIFRIYRITSFTAFDGSEITNNVTVYWDETIHRAAGKKR